MAKRSGDTRVVVVARAGVTSIAGSSPAALTNLPVALSTIRTTNQMKSHLYWLCIAAAYVGLLFMVIVFVGVALGYWDAFLLGFPILGCILALNGAVCASK